MQLARMEVLDEAIILDQEALDLCLPRYLDRAYSLNDLKRICPTPHFEDVPPDCSQSRWM